MIHATRTSSLHSVGGTPETTIWSRHHTTYFVLEGMSCAQTPTHNFLWNLRHDTQREPERI